jgi:hypothetical protein
MGGGGAGFKPALVRWPRIEKEPCFLVLNQHVWDGQGLKEPCFFGSFLEEQNHKEKLL